MKLRLVREARGHGRLYVDNVYLCFTQETEHGQGDLVLGRYEVLVEFNEEFRQELPRILADHECWLFPAKPYGPVVDGVAVGTVRNGIGVVNGFVALELLLERLESAYNAGAAIVIDVEEA